MSMHDCFQASSQISQLKATFFARSGVRVIVVTNEASPLRYLEGVVQHGIVADTSMLFVDVENKAYAAAGASGLSNLKDAVLDAAKSGKRWKDTIDKTHGNMTGGVSKNGSAFIALRMGAPADGQQRTDQPPTPEAVFFKQEFSFLTTPLAEACSALGASVEECAEIEVSMQEARKLLNVEY